MRLTRMLMVLTALMLLTGCANGTAVPAGSAGRHLDGTHWVLVAMGDEGADLPAAMQAWIEFTTDGQVTGNGGCNSFFGSYESDGKGALTFGMLGMTEMWCEETGDLETEFHKHLATVTGYVVEGDALKLMDENGMVVLLFEAGAPVVVEPEAGGQLEDRRWVLTGMSDMELQFAELTIFIQFDGDGQVTGNSGCNNFFGSYERDDAGSLSFGPLGMTKMYCEDTDALETEFHTHLANIVSYKVTGDVLQLFDENGLDVLRFRFDPDATVSSEPEAGGQLEDRRWVLAAMRDDESEPLFPTVRVFIEFASGGQVTGNGGCNGYFGDYESDSAGNLSFGPLGMTMMACEETGDLELDYHQRLATVTTYSVSGDVLRLMNGNGDVVLRFRVDPADASEIFTRKLLDSGTYPNSAVAAGNVTLSKGIYRAPAAEESAAEIRVTLQNFAAFGDLDGDGQEEAAVIFATSTGGSGTFYTMTTLDVAGENLYALVPVELGDRIQIRDLRVEGKDVVIDMVRHAPDDPLCCPTEEATVRFTILEGALIEKADM